MTSIWQQLAGAPTRLAQAAITATPTAVYTSASNNRTAILDLAICNTTAAAITVNVFIAGTATSNALFYGTSIAANSVTQYQGFQILNAGESLYVSASTIGLTITASGMANI